MLLDILKNTKMTKNDHDDQRMAYTTKRGKESCC